MRKITLTVRTRVAIEGAAARLAKTAAVEERERSIMCMLCV